MASLQRKTPDPWGSGAGAVEMAGIEPASGDVEPGLLRAHSALDFLGPHPTHRRVVNGPSYLVVLPTPVTRIKSSALLMTPVSLSLIHISEPTRLGMISYAVFCLKKK